MKEPINWKDDILGIAASHYFATGKNKKLRVNNSYGIPEYYPINIFFRDYEDMPDIERYALSMCYGDVLDIGSGAGSHALCLQNMSASVTTIDFSLRFINIQLKRGVGQIIFDNILNLHYGKYDTLLLMMNGIGLAQNINGLLQLLEHFKSIINYGGQIILDSTDVYYLWEEIESRPSYYGEVEFQFEYEKMKGEWFKWLYIDRIKLTEIGMEVGWRTEIIYEEDNGRFLARMTML